jgi:hypothetical protein
MIYVTNCLTNDGFGSQFQLIISLILVCIENGYQFIYNPIHSLEHNYENDTNFICKANHTMNLSSKFPTIEHQSQVEELRIHICDMTVKYVIDADIEKYTKEESLKLIREMFWENKDRSLLFQENSLKKLYTHVAIHIRRPNPHDANSFVDKDTPKDDYFYRVGTPDSYYLKVMQIIRESHSPEKPPLLFHIYSQGDISLFNSFVSEDTVLHINSDVFLSFTEMVGADILFTSFSSFSYIAAFLNEGTIYYHPFWHPPKNNWIQIPFSHF